MILKNRLKTIIDGVLIPYLVYVFVALLVDSVYTKLYGIEKRNPVFVQGIASIFILIILSFLYIRFKKTNGIKSEKVTFKNVLYVIPIAFSLCLICNILIEFIPKVSENRVTESVIAMTEEYNVFVSLFMVAVLIPIVEELLFRGLFYDTIKIISNDIYAIVFTSITFALAHFDVRQGIYALIAGILLGYIKYRYKNVIYTILMHLLMNFTSLVFVPGVLAFNTIKERLYVLFISVCILLFTLVRINIEDFNS